MCSKKEQMLGVKLQPATCLGFNLLSEMDEPQVSILLHHLWYMWSTPGWPNGPGTFCTWHPNAHAAGAEWRELLPLTGCPNLRWVRTTTMNKPSTSKNNGFNHCGGWPSLTHWLGYYWSLLSHGWGLGFVWICILYNFNRPSFAWQTFDACKEFWMPKCRKEFRRLVVDGGW